MTGASEYQKTGIYARVLPVLIVSVLLILAGAGCGKAADAKDRDISAGGTASGIVAMETEMPEGTDASPDAASENGSMKETVPVTALFPGESSYSPAETFVSVFHKDKAVGENGVLIDLSAVSDGYFGVSATLSGRAKCQVLKDGSTYTYDLKSDGTPSIFPLQMEDGTYSFRVLENVNGSKYAVVYSTEESISIADKFRPYLCASDYVNYTDSSSCVKKAGELAAGAADVNGVVTAVYEYVCAGVKYDREKARSVQVGYMPDPDETMQTGKGICFDYASLAAAMLRSQGIPCKVIFGYVSPNEVYHAWNMFYTEESGWITVKFEISAKNWNRLDLTFASNGADGSFIGDGSNYKDVYCY